MGGLRGRRDWCCLFFTREPSSRDSFRFVSFGRVVPRFSFKHWVDRVSLSFESALSHRSTLRLSLLPSSLDRLEISNPSLPSLLDSPPLKKDGSLRLRRRKPERSFWGRRARSSLRSVWFSLLFRQSGSRYLDPKATRRADQFLFPFRPLLLPPQFSLPSLPSYPRNTPIPYYLSILVLGPEGKGESTTINLPSPSDLRLSLRRTVSTTAKKASQKNKQDAGTILDLTQEQRIWYQPHEWVEVERGERRWGGEIVVVGEFELGGGAATATIREEETKGLLACDVSLTFLSLRVGLVWRRWNGGGKELFRSTRR